MINVDTKLMHPKVIIFLTITALVVYLFLALFINRNFIGSDGRSFQRMAVNLAEGNGFSSKIDPPYEPQFFREPGYPFLFSIACRINSVLGNENNHLSYEADEPGYHDPSHTEITILRIIQAILAVLSVLLYYKIMLNFLSSKVALIVALLFIFYLPFSIFVTFPQREMLVTFLMMVMTYLFILSARSHNSYLHDTIFGITAAFLVLTLQAYVFILPFFLLPHLMITKSFAKTLKSVSVVAIVFLIGVAPWTYRGYKEAKDWRVIKTFGISYTYEFKKFHDANAKAYWNNLFGERDSFKKKIIEGYSEPGGVMFDKSFNGYYKNYADSLNQVIKSNSSGSSFSAFKSNMLEIIKRNYRKALIWPLWKPDYRENLSTIINSHQKIQILISLTIGLVIGVFAISGLFLYVYKVWYYLPVFLFHFLMIPLMADEARRVLPFMPFYFMFFILFLRFALKKESLKN